MMTKSGFSSSVRADFTPMNLNCNLKPKNTLVQAKVTSTYMNRLCASTNFLCLCSFARQIKIKLFQTLSLHFQVFHRAKISQKVWSVLGLGINIGRVWFRERSIVRKTFVARFLLVLRGGLLSDLNLARVCP